MSDPIYEIPILPPGANVGGWTPGIKPRSDADSLVPEDSNSRFAARGGFDDFSRGTETREPATEILTTPNEPATEVLNRQSTLYSPPAPPVFDRPPAGQPMTRSEANRFAQRAAAERAAQEALTVQLAEAAAQQTQAPAEALAQPAFEPPQSWQPPVASQREPDTQRESWSFAEPVVTPEALRDVTLRDALEEVVRLNASDLHVTVDAPPMVRVNGGLRAIDGAATWTREKIESELSALLNTTQAATFQTELELDFAHTLSEESRFRVNYYQQRGAIGAAFRLIPTEIKRLSDLGVPDTVSRFATLPRGLVLVTGPTGSGKSTTLAGLIDLVNRTRADHIVTVEDPIEFMHKNQKSIVNQREVGSDTHSFANALKHVLRQDPDVILIGELRDLETISVALTAAETGHLVFATLHTQDAAQTIDRIIDVFPSHQQDQVRTQLAGTLQGVVSQTLVPKASGSGRVVATEVMVITPALANLIREGKTYQILSAMQAGKELGMHTMDQHLAELVNSGRITAQAAKAKAHDPDGFQRMLHGVQSPTEEAARAMQASGIDFGDSFSTKLER